MVAGWMMSVTTSLPPRVMVRLEVRSVVMVLTSVLVSVRRLVLRMSGGRCWYRLAYWFSEGTILTALLRVGARG